MLYTRNSYNSQLALSSGDLDGLVHATTAAVTQMLEIEYCKVLELLPDGESFRLRAGVGWQPGLVEETVIGTE